MKIEYDEEFNSIKLDEIYSIQNESLEQDSSYNIKRRSGLLSVFCDIEDVDSDDLLNYNTLEAFPGNYYHLDSVSDTTLASPKF
jgi:hypothetical protein